MKCEIPRLQMQTLGCREVSLEEFKSRQWSYGDMECFSDFMYVQKHLGKVFKGGSCVVVVHSEIKYL